MKTTQIILALHFIAFYFAGAVTSITAAHAKGDEAGRTSYYSLPKLPKQEVIDYISSPQIRTDLITALNSLSIGQIAKVIPRDLSVELLTSLVASVNYELHDSSANAKKSLERRGRLVPAITKLNKLSPADLMLRVQAKRSFNDPDIKSQLSAIVFDVYEIARTPGAQIQDILFLAYYMHLIQLGKTHHEASLYGEALANIVIAAR